MASYLCQRCQQVVIAENASADVPQGHDVPQGSVVGPKLYSLYTRPQLYVSFMNSDREERTAAITRLNDCTRDVRTWLTRNMLKLNDEKTEVILFTFIHGLKSLPNITVTVGEQQQLQSSSVHDLGVIYDQHWV